MYIVRPAVQEDIEPACLMMWESYDYVKAKEPTDFFSKAIAADPFFKPEYLRVVSEGDQIVATVYIARREILDGGEYRLLGGIGDVAVHPDHRGKGLSLMVLQDAVDYMKANGYFVSTLYTGHVGLYEKVGFQRPDGRVRVSGRVPGERMPLDSTKDFEAAKSLYERSSGRVPGSIRRNDDYWTHLIAGRRLLNADIVYSAGRDAYVMCMEIPEEDLLYIMDAGFADSPDQLRDLVATALTGRNVASPTSDQSHPVIAGIKAALADPVESESGGLMACQLGELPMPEAFNEMDVDHF